MAVAPVASDDGAAAMAAGAAGVDGGPVGATAVDDDANGGNGLVNATCGWCHGHARGAAWRNSCGRKAGAWTANHQSGATSLAVHMSNTWYFGGGGGNGGCSVLDGDDDETVAADAMIDKGCVRVKSRCGRILMARLQRGECNGFGQGL